MWQGHLIRPASSHPFPHSQPPPHRVYTPTPDGFERFLQACLGLSRGEAPHPGGVVRGPSPVRHDPRG
jgi:hypothetical protein